MSTHVTVTPDEARRLAFIKYVLSLANAQTRQPELLAGVAVLHYHDAVDLFLQLAAGHYNLDVHQRASIMEYFEPISKALGSDGPLPHRESIRRLSRVRDNLKHAGVPPPRVSIDEFERTVNRFFEQTVPLVFNGQTLDSISMIDFIQSPTARDRLKQAELARETDGLAAGLTHCAVAFDSLVKDYD